MEKTRLISSPEDVKIYVLDKALNYGNSGGPIIAVATGHVQALCSRFQPVMIPQPHLKDQKGKPPYIVIPSLYGQFLSAASSRRRLSESASVGRSSGLCVGR